MSNKHSEASKARWAAIPKEERSKRMSVLALKRIEQLGPLGVKKLIKKMVKAQKHT